MSSLPDRNPRKLSTTLDSLKLSHKRKASKDAVLEAGMAITIEPGIYSPELGGVRIEDTVILTEDGHDNFTQRSTDSLLYADRALKGLVLRGEAQYASS